MFSSKSKVSFTLMEVMVSVVLLSLILTLVSSFLWLNFNISTRAKAVSQDYYGVRNILELIASDISSAFKFEYGDYDNILIENASSISFWYVKPDVLTKENYSKPILRISYYMKDLNGEKSLFKRLEDPFSDYSEEFVVYSDIDFRFSANTYDNVSKSLIELDNYSKNDFPQAVIIRSNIEGELIEKKVLLLQDNKI